MKKWLTKWFHKETSKKQETSIIQPIPTPANVEAPVLGFVATVKANPRRFRVRLVPGSNWDRRPKYTVLDKLMDLKFEAQYAGGRLASVTGIDFKLSWAEKVYLHEQLSPIFQRSLERKQRMHLAKWEREQALVKQRDILLREQWTAIYG